MPKTRRPDRAGLRTTLQLPVSVLSSVKLTNRKNWNEKAAGAYSVVRFNFLAQVSPLSNPVAFIDDPEMVIPQSGARWWQPIGRMDVVQTAALTVSDELVEDVNRILTRHRIEHSRDRWSKARDDIRSAVVGNVIRPGSSVDVEIARRESPTRVQVEQAANLPMLLLGQRRVDLFLGYVDFLRVDYSVKTFGRNLVRVKRPPYNEKNVSRSNEFGMDGIAFASFFVFEAHSVDTPPAKLVRATTDDLQLGHVIDPPRAGSGAGERIYPEIATLYQASNPAFPISRTMARARSWTENDLIALPLAPGKAKVPVRDVFPDGRTD